MLKCGNLFLLDTFLPSHAENFNIFPLLLVNLRILLPNTLKVFRTLLLLTLILSLPKKEKQSLIDCRVECAVRVICVLAKKNPTKSSKE